MSDFSMPVPMSVEIEPCPKCSHTSPTTPCPVCGCEDSHHERCAQDMNRGYRGHTTSNPLSTWSTAALINELGKRAVTAGMGVEEFIREARESIRSESL